MARKKRNRVQHKVAPHNALRDLPLWQVHRMLADLPPQKQKQRICVLAEAGHPDAPQLIITFGVPL